MVACVIVACGVALSVLLALRGQKEPTKTFDFEGFEEYKVEPLEYPNSMRLVYLVPYDADPEELYAHMQQAIESMREDVPDMYSAYVEYYEAPLFYENHNTPVADGVWGPRGSTIPLYGIEPGDYSQHIFTFHVYPYDADYALTEEEWALYQEILEYFLYEKGCQPYYIDPEDPYKYPDRVEEYRHLAERLGCSCETLMGLPNKVFLWRPSTVDCLPDNG